MRHLGWHQVREIRRTFDTPTRGVSDGERKRRLAREHRVSVRTIQRIIAGTIWVPK